MAYGYPDTITTFIEIVETDKCKLLVAECQCGFRFGFDATYVEQVGEFEFHCPSCAKLINTEIAFGKTDLSRGSDGKITMVRPEKNERKLRLNDGKLRLKGPLKDRAKT